MSLSGHFAAFLPAWEPLGSVFSTWLSNEIWKNFVYLRPLQLCRIWLNRSLRSWRERREKELTHGHSGNVHHCIDVIFLGNQRTVAKQEALLQGFTNGSSDVPWTRREEHVGRRLPCAAHSVNLHTNLN